MKEKILLVFVTLVILFGLGYYSYTVYRSPEREPPQTVLPEPEERTPQPKLIWLSGKVVPVRQSELSFAIGGRVVELPVREGDVVEKGQLLARLDDAELKAAVAEAEAAVEAAEARLAALKARPRKAELDAAQAAVQEAEALLSAARAELAEAQARLRELEAGPSEEEIEAAKAEMEQAFAVLKRAQAEYDKIAWAPDAAARPEALALEEATAAYNAAKARYQVLVKGPGEDAIEAARARVSAAYAGVRAAEARLAQAQARYEILKAGAPDEEIRSARASLDEAKAALARAEADLEKAYLRAPFRGTVGKVWVREGEVVSAGQPVLTLGDLSTLQVELALKERYLGELYQGRDVLITFEAIPGLHLHGRVTYVSVMASSSKDATSFTACVALDGTDSRLRWGMTAYVGVEVGD